MGSTSQPFVVSQNAQILQRPPTASKHENQRKNMSRGSYPAALPDEAVHDQSSSRTPIARKYSPISANPLCA